MLPQETSPNAKKTEAALEEERNKFASVAEAIGAGLVIISKDYRVLWANDFIKRYKGDTIGKLCYASLNSLDSPCSDCGVAKIFAGKTTHDSHEYFSTTLDGNPYWVQIVATPITDEKGNITSAAEIAVDITERKNAMDKLSKNQYLTQKILDCSPNLIYIYDLVENCNVYTNREVLDFLGYNPLEIKIMGSELFANILHPDDAKAVANHHARFKHAPDNATYDVEYRMKHASGEWRWLRSRDTLFARTKEGLGKQILGICEDVTDRKKDEEHRKVLEKKVKEYSQHLKCMVDLRTTQLKDANERLIKSERLAAIGELGRHGWT